MINDFLIPECFFEKELLIKLGYNTKDHINKAKGCTGVLSVIQKSYAKKVAIGWIDEDPNQQYNRPSYYYHYKQIDSSHKVSLKKKVGTNHYLIEIQNEFEPWFENIGKAKGIKKEDFGIKYLHQYAGKTIKNNVKDYLYAVVDANEAPFNYIQSVIVNILKGKYQDN